MLLTQTLSSVSPDPFPPHNLQEAIAQPTMIVILTFMAAELYLMISKAFQGQFATGILVHALPILSIIHIRSGVIPSQLFIRMTHPADSMKISPMMKLRVILAKMN